MVIITPSLSYFAFNSWQSFGVRIDLRASFGVVSNLSSYKGESISRISFEMNIAMLPLLMTSPNSFMSFIQIITCRTSSATGRLNDRTNFLHLKALKVSSLLTFPRVSLMYTSEKIPRQHGQECCCSSLVSSSSWVTTIPFCWEKIF